MDYLEAAREALGPEPSVQGGYLAEERRSYASACALIAIAEELRKLNESLGRVRLVIDEQLAEMGYATPV